MLDDDIAILELDSNAFLEIYEFKVLKLSCIFID
jgi:hypothetical protein